MPRSPRLLVLPLLVLPTLLLGCAESDSESDSEDDPGRSAPATSADSPTACTTEPTSTGLYTDPGQVLCLGTPAVLPLTTSSDSQATGRMSLVVTGIERGDDTVIDDEITEGMAEWTADSRDLWYVRLESELLSEKFPGALDGKDPLGILTGIRSADGEVGESYIDFDIDGTVGDCERRVFDGEDPGPFETCAWRVMAPGAVPTQASWSETGDYFGEGAIVWSAT